MGSPSCCLYFNCILKHPISTVVLLIFCISLCQVVNANKIFLLYSVRIWGDSICLKITSLFMCLVAFIITLMYVRENSEHTLGVQSKDASVFEYSYTLSENLENHRKLKANRMSYFFCCAHLIFLLIKQFKLYILWRQQLSYLSSQ